MITVVHAPQILASAANPMKVRLTSDDVSQPNHRFLVELAISNDEISTQLNLLEFPVGSQAEFDISALLLAFMQARDIILPGESDNVNTLTDVTGFTIAKYHMAIKEQFGVPLGPVSLSDLFPPSVSDYYVLNGGFSYPNWPVEKYIIEWFYQQGDDQKFLTWKPVACLVGKNQPEYLTFVDVNPGGSRILRRKVIVHYTNGTTDTATSSFSITDRFKAYRFCVGYNQLNLNSLLAGRTVHYYEVYIDDGTKRVSEKRLYYVDHNKPLAERFVIFQNSLGGFDTARFIGLGEFAADYNRSYANKYNGQFTNDLGTRVSYNNYEQAGRKINSGFISRKEMQWLRDLMLSREVFVWENEACVPVEIVSKKFAYPEENSTNALTVEYDYRFTNTVFTPVRQTVNYEP